MTTFEVNNGKRTIMVVYSGIFINLKLRRKMYTDCILIILQRIIFLNSPKSGIKICNINIYISLIHQTVVENIKFSVKQK